MSKFSKRFDGLKLAFSRLPQRDQTLIVLTSGILALVFLVGTTVGVSLTLKKVSHRLSVKLEELTEVIQLQTDYQARQDERAARMRDLSASQVRLISVVELAAKQAGIEIGQLRPEEGQPSPEGIVESRVDLRAGGLSADRVQNFLEALEKSQGVVIVRRLRLSRPYSKDTVDLDMTITTYKLKAS